MGYVASTIPFEIKQNIYFEMNTLSNGYGLSIDIFNTDFKYKLYLVDDPYNGPVIQIYEIIDSKNTSLIEKTSIYFKGLVSFGINKFNKTISIYENGKVILEDIKFAYDLINTPLYIKVHSTWDSREFTCTFNFGATEWKYPNIASKFLTDKNRVFIDNQDNTYGIS